LKEGREGAEKLDLILKVADYFWMRLSELKNREATQRMTALRRAQKSRPAARTQQRRVSLAGGRNWRITDPDGTLAAMGSWA
jgi:hypothetical protein